MYSSVSDAEYRFRKEKAEQEARTAYDRFAQNQSSADVHSPEAAPANAAPVKTVPSRGRIQRFLSGLRDDDLLLIGILFLLLNENKDDDPLILIILAVLLFT